jgi:hypothetical protein
MTVPKVEIEVMKAPVSDARLEVRVLDPVNPARHHLDKGSFRHEDPEGIVPRRYRQNLGVGEQPMKVLPLPGPDHQHVWSAEILYGRDEGVIQTDPHSSILSAG